ncbi:glycosyltransferase family 1 protein [Photorhabdus tasmaniensis]
MVINLARVGREGTGLWQYTLKFIKAMSNLRKVNGIICAKSQERFFISLGVPMIIVPDIVSNTSKISRVRPILWLLYTPCLALRVYMKFGLCKVVSTTHHNIPFLRRQIITIHDLRPYTYPDSFLQRVYFRYILPMLVKRCSHILTVSNTVKKQISLYYSVSEEAISVIYNSIELADFKPTSKKEDYLLAVGTSWPHKNIHSLLTVSEVWREKYNLIIVCGRTNYAVHLRELVAQVSLNKKVVILHDVNFEKLCSLYAHASALIYPSLDEGFGIPPIEAMASHTPVIVSNIPVFHEVLGDSAIYVNPNDKNSWISAFESLQEPKTWTDKGIAKASYYDSHLMTKMVSNWLEKMKK